MTKTALVTGANSGIGRATAIYLAEQGYRVFGSVRRRASAEKLLAMAGAAGVEVELVEMDIASDESVRTAMAAVLADVGFIDLLVNNAGIGGNAVVEESPTSMLLDVMNVNLCGAVRCAQAVLPTMRERGEGCIVNITSVTGRIGAVGQGPYVASKWALEGLSEELAHEVAPFGIRVAIVEPGLTKTAIFAKNVDAPQPTGAYDEQYRRMFAMYAAGIPVATDPAEVGQVVHHAATTDEPRLRYTCSWGGPEIVEGRARMSDEDWVELGRAKGDDEYARGFKKAFGLEIGPFG
jgi:NAD(P)-dependent dehydrogenase (short-subunit alcohol dehydrogenase family)